MLFLFNLKENTEEMRETAVGNYYGTYYLQLRFVWSLSSKLPGEDSWRENAHREEA
jgi:hypothetical protein